MDFSFVEKPWHVHMNLCTSVQAASMQGAHIPQMALILSCHYCDPCGLCQLFLMTVAIVPLLEWVKGVGTVNTVIQEQSC